MSLLFLTKSDCAHTATDESESRYNQLKSICTLYMHSSNFLKLLSNALFSSLSDTFYQNTLYDEKYFKNWFMVYYSIFFKVDYTWFISLPVVLLATSRPRTNVWLPNTCQKNCCKKFTNQILWSAHIRSLHYGVLQLYMCISKYLILCRVWFYPSQ